MTETLRDIKDIKLILAREFGGLPLGYEGEARFLEPIIFNDREITEEVSFNIKSRLGGKATSGHIKNTGSDILQISWDAGKRSEFLPWYDLEPEEIINFNNDYLNRLRLRPESGSANFKAILK